MKEKQINEKLVELGFDIKATNPTGRVEDNNWPCVAFDTVITYKGKQAWRGDYRMGVGHFSPDKASSMTRVTMKRDDNLFMNWDANRQAVFKDKGAWAVTASRVAKMSKITPSLADVMHSLISDGSAFFNAQTFEDWASDCGYDTDSRKAEQTWRECDAIGRALARSIPEKVLSEVRELLADY